jgi:hypothetical protein
MNSWDCFDTLVARRFVEPISIFREVEKRFNISNFTKRRRKAEKETKGTYAEIYKLLPDVNPNYEFEIELEHCFGIRENINKVQDGDIIISDMYLSAEQIKKILLKCGLHKNVKIIVSTCGKKKRYIWNQITEKIELHTGDNFDSDVKSPQEFSIPAQHYTSHQFNSIEKLIAETDFDLACWSRYIRLSCPFNTKHEKMLWADQANLNLPVLALSTLELPTNMEISFSYRDSAYWHKLYQSMTGKLGIRLDISRLCTNNPSEEFKQYVFDTVKGTLIVDLTGSGESAKMFYPSNYNILYIAGPVVAPYTYLANRVTRAIERHNVTDIDPLIGWQGGPIRGINEHDKRATTVQGKSIDIACNSVNWFKFKSNRNLLEILVQKMSHNYTHQNVKYKKS